MLVGQNSPKLIGAPKIEDMPPLSPEDMPKVAEPIQAALAQGVPINAPCTVEFGMVVRLISTVLSLQGEAGGEE